MSEPAILVERLAVVAGGRPILSLDRLEISPHELVTVLGPNGAGKSTLLKVCARLLRPARGQVQVLGESVTNLGPWSATRLRRRVGYLPQPLVATTQAPLTVREVVAVGRTGLVGLLRPLGREDWRRVDEIIEQLGLAQVRRAPYSTLSGGEQRRALLARVLVQSPELLLLDEPTANLDLGAREQLVDLLDGLHDRLRVTTLLVCHELEVIPRACRRVLVLDGGRLLADGRPEEVLTSDCVRRLYGAELGVVHRGGRHATVPAERAAP